MRQVQYGDVFLFGADTPEELAALRGASATRARDVIYRGNSREDLLALLSRLRLDNPDGCTVFEDVTADGNPRVSG